MAELGHDPGHSENINIALMAEENILSAVDRSQLGKCRLSKTWLYGAFCFILYGQNLCNIQNPYLRLVSTTPEKDRMASSLLPLTFSIYSCSG